MVMLLNIAGVSGLALLTIVGIASLKGTASIVLDDSWVPKAS